MAYEFILTEEREGAAVITYNRPDKMNALNVGMYLETVEAIEAANANEAVGAIVLASTGKAFCAGTDFKDRGSRTDDKGRPLSVATLGMAVDKSWLHLLRRSKPVVVAVNGICMGLGGTHILPADIRIAGESATFSFPFTKLGFMPEFGGSALLPQLVGLGEAVDLCMSSRTIDAQEARRIGLVTRVVPDPELREAAIALAVQIAGYKHWQMQTTKELLYDNALETDLNTLLRRESMKFIEMAKRNRAAQEAARAD